MHREIFIVDNKENREVIFPADEAQSLISFLAGNRCHGRHLISVFTCSYDSDGLLTPASNAELKRAIRLWFAETGVRFTENGDSFTYESSAMRNPHAPGQQNKAKG
jgi:hypothetical protein